MRNAPLFMESARSQRLLESRVIGKFAVVAENAVFMEQGRCHFPVNTAMRMRAWLA
jgi:hypothetical protein